MRKVMGENESCWLNYHLYYHQDVGYAIHHFVRPLVIKLLRSDWIDSFFFIRYSLGGPHIRLRLHPRPGASVLVTEVVEAGARDFLASRPSTSKLTREAILRSNQEILASDLHEFDASVYPDNTLLIFPFRPEIERYGGPELWGDSLDFFALSSATVLELLSRYGSEPRSRQLALAFRVLACQALSFARDEEDLVSLLRYAVDIWGRKMPRALAKADHVFVEQKRTFDKLFERELYILTAETNAAATAGEEAKAQLGEAARRLAWIARAADRGVHQRIGTSQLHMTANRLGLSNAEEVYLSQILTRLVSELIASGEALGRLSAATGVSCEGETVTSPLRDLLPGALARMTALRLNPEEVSGGVRQVSLGKGPLSPSP
jgi:thiopeptide-type bacteriocin biosynthesis protein